MFILNFKRITLARGLLHRVLRSEADKGPGNRALYGVIGRYTEGRNRPGIQVFINDVAFYLRDIQSQGDRAAARRPQCAKLVGVLWQTYFAD